MLDVSGGPAVREARSRANAFLEPITTMSAGGASWAVKAHFCDRRHIASATAELGWCLSIVPQMRFSRSTFLRDTQPRSRGALFFAAASFNRSNVDGASNLHARPPDSFQSADVAISPECNGAHKALLVPPLNSAAAHNDVSLASGGGHGTQSNEIRTRLLDGPCSGGDHPGDQTMGGGARLAEQVGGANSGAGHHLPAATLESVLRARQAVRGTNNAFLTPHPACRDGCPHQRPLRARHASAEAVYDSVTCRFVLSHLVLKRPFSLGFCTGAMSHSAT